MMTSAGEPSVKRWTISADIFLCWHTTAASLTCSIKSCWLSVCLLDCFSQHVLCYTSLSQTLMLSGRPSSVSMSSTYSVRTSAHISYKGRTRHVRLVPSLTSLVGFHEMAALSGDTLDASSIFSCLAATAADLASTSCRALDHGPKVLACKKQTTGQHSKIGRAMQMLICMYLLPCLSVPLTPPHRHQQHNLQSVRHACTTGEAPLLSASFHHVGNSASRARSCRSGT